MATIKSVSALIVDGDWIESKDQSPEGIRLIQTGNIGIGAYLDKPNRAKYISEETFERLNCTELNIGDILVSRLPDPIGRACRVPDNIGRAITAVDCTIIRLNPDKCDAEYFVQYTQSELYQNRLSQFFAGSTRTRISRKNLEQIEIPLPNIAEQRRIASTLGKVDALITLRKEQLAKLDQLVKSRFIELLGDINTNDKNWDSQPLEELCTIVRGGSPRPIENFLGGDVPWIKIGDATKGDNIYLHATKEHIIQDGVKKSRLVKSGSLIFANCGVSLGFARIITFDGCIHDGWLAMEDIDTRLDKVFLLQALNQMTDHFRKIAPAGTQPNLNTAIMKAYVQIIPPMELQKEYIAFVEQIDKSKLAIQQSLDKLELLKKSLMQEYFG